MLLSINMYFCIIVMYVIVSSPWCNIQKVLFTVIYPLLALGKYSWFRRKKYEKEERKVQREKRKERRRDGRKEGKKKDCLASPQKSRVERRLVCIQFLPRVLYPMFLTPEDVEMALRKWLTELEILCKRIIVYIILFFLILERKWSTNK